MTSIRRGEGEVSGHPRRLVRALYGCLLAGMFATLGPACSQADPPVAVAEPVLEVADPSLHEDPEPVPPPPLPDAVIETRDAILAAADAGSIRRLARIADAQQAFLSNLGNEPHYDHWYLMRATGFNVIREVEDLFEEPYGAKRVGSETWYIWPDLAALEGEDLALERLAFRDRVRLEAFIGEAGIAAVRAGQPYPGIRTAIAEDGGWRYFLHESGLVAPGDEEK